MTASFRMHLHRLNTFIIIIVLPDYTTTCCRAMLESRADVVSEIIARESYQSGVSDAINAKVWFAQAIRAAYLDG